MPSVYQRVLRFLGWAKPLALELAEACEAVQGLRKTGYNEEENFHFLKINELADKLRAELLPRGIVIIPSDLECLNTSWQVNGEIVDGVRVKTEFEITDGRRRMVKIAYGEARVGNYTVAVAQAFAFKSLLKRLGMIFGEDEDAEAQRWQWPGEHKSMGNYRDRALAAALRSCNLTRDGAEAWLSKSMGFPVTLTMVEQLPQKDFDIAIAALEKHGGLEEVLEMSAERLGRRGPQPIVAAAESMPDDMTGD